MILLLFFTNKLWAQSDTLGLRPEINQIVKKLQKEKMVHFGYIVGSWGIRETDNVYYNLFLKLKETATDEELVLLTKSKEKCIVIYAYEILWSRKYPDLKNICFQHQNDTTLFTIASGCTGMEYYINSYMIMKLYTD